MCLFYFLILFHLLSPIRLSSRFLFNLSYVLIIYNYLIKNEFTLIILTYVNHPCDRGNCYVFVPRVRRIDMLYASHIRIRQIFRVCESMRHTLPVDGRRETFRGENAQGIAAISVETHFSPPRLEMKYPVIFFLFRRWILAILERYVDLTKRARIFERRIFKLKW